MTVIYYSFILDGKNKNIKMMSILWESLKILNQIAL